jgi:hypothetical protein
MRGRLKDRRHITFGLRTSAPVPSPTCREGALLAAVDERMERASGSRGPCNSKHQPVRDSPIDHDRPRSTNSRKRSRPLLQRNLPNPHHLCREGGVDGTCETRVSAWVCQLGLGYPSESICGRWPASCVRTCDDTDLIQAAFYCLYLMDLFGAFRGN